MKDWRIGECSLRRVEEIEECSDFRSFLELRLLSELQGQGPSPSARFIRNQILSKGLRFNGM